MKASDFIQLLEYGKAFKDPKPKRRKKDELDFSGMDVTSFLHREIEKAEALKKLLADYEKANKKDDKPKDKDGWSMHQVAFFLIATFPITAPLYVSYVRALLPH